MAQEQEALSVGVDLGTSRSAVSASSGARHLVLSYVGWPLDMVARRVVKSDVLVGEEALENRLMLDLHRPLERGLIKEGSDRDAKAVRELLKNVLLLAGAEEAREDGSPVRAVVGVPAEAMRVNKQQLRSAMAGLVDSLMIVSEPFAVAYGLDALLHALIIDIGAGTTDLCVMNGRYPRDEDQKTLTVAGDSVDDQLEQLIQARYPEANFSRHMVTSWKETGSFVGELSGKIMVTAPVQGRPTKFDITDEMRTACASLVAPVVEAMLDLISRVEPEYQNRVRNNVILTGGSSLISGLGAALQEALKEVGGGKVRVVKDPAFVGADGGLAIATDAPDSDWETLSA